MCGILGVIGYNSTELSKQFPQRVLAHRGPDGHGILCRNNILFVHNRLSIIDIEGGAQPMCSEDKQFAITFNGEIYNFQSLRSEIKKAGYHFYSKSDTEVILNAYRLWGNKCVTRLRGMFSFAIVDFKRRTLFLARDHLGIKPLLYSFIEKHFCFASEFQGLLSLPWIKERREANPQGLYELLRFGYTTAPNSVYKKIYKLPPAHWLEIDCDHPSKLVMPTCYWQMDYNPDESLTSEDCEELVDEAIRDSVRAHLISDVPYGAFLSGGLDSTTVVAYMSEILDVPVRSFSIGFKEEKYDERPFARVAANRLATEHYEEVVTEDALSLIPKLIQHYGEPFGDSSAVPTWHISRLARSHVPMVLSGDGGDEFFGGYNSYRSWLTQLDPNYRDSPHPRWLILVRALMSKLMPSRFPPKPLPPKTPLERWINISGIYKGYQIEQLLNKEFQEVIDYIPNSMRLAYEKMKNKPFLTVARNIDIHNYLPSDILTKVDIASMMHGLEVRTPLTDVRIAELSGRIPWYRLIENRKHSIGWTGKLPLRRILTRHFNEDFINRQKQGFGIPVREWLFADSKNAIEIREKLLSPTARIKNWLRPTAVKSILDKELGYQTWHLLVLEEWLDQNRL